MNMGEILIVRGPKQIDFETYEELPLKEGEVRLKTLYSGISAGTQLTIFRGRNPYNTKKWDAHLRIFEKAEEKHTFFPVRGAWGYEEVGQVSELGPGVWDVKPGDIIYGTWSHKSTHVVTEDFAVRHRLPEGLDPVAGIYSQMGSIALNAVLDADIHLGETVAVFGQGVPGQLVLQMARLSGAYVIAVDMDDRRLAYSRKYGAEAVLNPTRCDVGRTIKEMTDGKGADTCIEISGSDAALQEAIRSTAYNGRVICSGFMPGNASQLVLGEEFHHNRIQILCSQIAGVNPSLDHRWDRQRMENTVMKLAAAGRLDLTGLVTHRVPFREAAAAYAMLDQGTEECLQVVLQF